MAKKIKRKKRKVAIKQVDLYNAIDTDKFGTEDDPCFGKFFDPKEKECQVCGDCEICSIIMGQKLHLQRAAIESEQQFKDLAEKSLLNSPINIIYERLRRAEGKWVSIDALKRELKRKGIGTKKQLKLETEGFFERLFKDTKLKGNSDKTKLKLL